MKKLFWIHRADHGKGMRKSDWRQQSWNYLWVLLIVLEKVLEFKVQVCWNYGFVGMDTFFLLALKSLIRIEKQDGCPNFCIEACKAECYAAQLNCGVIWVLNGIRSFQNCQLSCTTELWLYFFYCLSFGSKNASFTDPLIVALV